MTVVDRIFSCGVDRVVFLPSSQAQKSVNMLNNNTANRWADMENRILSMEESKFNTLAAEIHLWQLRNNATFGRWCQLNQLENAFPTFLPIQFFKTQSVLSIEKTWIADLDSQTSDTLTSLPYLLFESSGTTLQQTSKHWVYNPKLYEQSFLQTFESRFGKVSELCIIGLLPSYLERQNSSLVYMVDNLIHQSGSPNSGFYLYEYEKLWKLLQENELNTVPTVVFGVTFALLELAEYVNTNHPTQKPIHPTGHSPIQWVETGGMKGRGKELTRKELHNKLTQSFGVKSIQSEYGMTELLSQAYTRASDGRFQCPPWMKVMVCDPMDPQDFLPWGKTGRICVIDLANLYSCSFIATDDLGKVYEDGSFEVLGRLDFSDLRGCNQLM